MIRTMLKSKLHRVTTTNSELSYEGSCAIDAQLLAEANIFPYEQLHIYNVNNGNRFTTYAIEAEPNTGIISINGAAARLAQVGDILIICTYAQYSPSDMLNYKPRVIYVSDKNVIL